MISEIYILFFKASLTIRHTATVSQKKSGTSKKIQWDFQISRVGSLDFLDLKVNGSPGDIVTVSIAKVDQNPTTLGALDAEIRKLNQVLVKASEQSGPTRVAKPR